MQSGTRTVQFDHKKRSMCRKHMWIDSIDWNVFNTISKGKIHITKSEDLNFASRENCRSCGHHKPSQAQGVGVRSSPYWDLCKLLSWARAVGSGHRQIWRCLICLDIRLFKIVYLETSNLLLIFAYGGFCENMVQGVLDCVSSVPEVRHTPMIGDAARPKCQKRTLYEQRKV